jgi:microcystin-dependent protein
LEQNFNSGSNFGLGSVTTGAGSTDSATTGITVSTTTTTTITESNVGGGNSHTNIPPYLAMGYIIKT